MTDIRKAMAMQLWYVLWDRTGRSQMDRKPAGPPAAATKAARDLEKLYLELNGARSLEALYAHAKRGGWEDKKARPGAAGPWQFGNWLVNLAMGHTVTWMGAPPAGRVGIKVPRFEATLDGAEVVWDGSATAARGARQHARWSPVVNPGTRHPETRSLAEVRELLAARAPEDKCYPTCQGWEIFRVDRDPGLEIEACDECNAHQPTQLQVFDDDVEQLPEAQLALAKAIEAEEVEEAEEVAGAVREIHGGKVVPRVNPSGGYYALYYEPGGSRTKPKEYHGPFSSKAQADAAVSADIAKYGSSGTHVVKQLTPAQFDRLWHGQHGAGLPPGVPNPRRSQRNPSIEEDLGIENPSRHYVGNVFSIGERVKVRWDHGDWYGVITKVSGAPGRQKLKVRAEDTFEHPGINKGYVYDVDGHEAGQR